MTKTNDTATENRRDMDRVVPQNDNFVLIELPSGEERLEPLLDFSPHGVAVLIRAPRMALNPGTRLKRVRFFSGGECNLQSQATVRDAQILTLENGTTGIKLGLRLDGHSEPSHSQPVIYEYPQPNIITDALQNLISSEVLFSIVDSSKSMLPAQECCRLLKADEEQKVLTAELTNTEPLDLKIDCPTTLETVLYGNRLALVAELKNRIDQKLFFSWPTLLRVWHHRLGGRLRNLSAPLSVEFESPFVPGRLSREVLDISPSGLAVSTNAEDGLLVGMLLRSLVLHLPKGTVQSSCVVRNVRRTPDGRSLAGLELNNMSENAKRILAEFVDTNFHPQIKSPSAADLKAIWPVFESLAVFQRPHTVVNPTMNRVEGTRRTLISRGRSVHVQMVGFANDEICGTAEFWRSYSTTWSLQHAGCLPNSCVKLDQIVVPLFQAIARRSDFTHLHAILDPSRSQDGLAKMAAIENDDKSWVADGRELLTEGPTYLAPRIIQDDIHMAGPGDLDWVSERLKEKLLPLEFAALRLSPSELLLEDTDRIYHAIGLARQRLVRIAMSVSGPLGFSLIEQSSPGLSLDGLSDLVRLYSTAPQGEQDANLLISLAHDAVRLQRDAGRRRTLILTAPQNARILLAAGFISLGTRTKVVANREGAQRLINCFNLLS